MKNLLKLCLLLSILISTSLYAKHTLYLNIIDLDNMISFEDFYSKKLKTRFKSKDIFFVFDAKNMQYISSIKFNREDSRKYKNKRVFINRFKKKLLKTYEKNLNKYNDYFIKERILTEEKNNFARQLKVVGEVISAYKHEYDIKVYLFGNSYLHNAYKHNFNKGIPTDGFIYLENSEFNTFNNLNTPEVEFSIFFDDEPSNDKNRMFRFYKKLLLKKFDSTLQTFNDTTSLHTEKNMEYSDSDFRKNSLDIIGEKKENDCIEHDNVKAVFSDKNAVINVKINNICRRDSLITLYHNGGSKQIILDKNGKGNVKLDALIGKNIVHYFNLNGDKKVIYEDDIIAAENDIKFNKDSAKGTVTVYGYNPLRKNDNQVKIHYKTTGSYIYLDVNDGHYEKTVPLKIGDNLFEWKDLNGKLHQKIITLDERCSDKVDIDNKYAEEYGIAQITLQNECRENGSLVEFFYREMHYKSMIINGKTSIEIVLNSDINNIFFNNFDGDKEKVSSIKIREFNDLIRFIISYKDNVILSMNIFEPNIKIDTSKAKFGVSYDTPSEFKEGHVHIKNTTSKVGKILIGDIPSIADYLSLKYIKYYKQVYVTRRSELKSGTIVFYIDYFSRHGKYSGEKPLCGNRSLGGVVVDYEILDKGSSEISEKFLNPSRCVKSVEDGSLVPKNEDNELVLIKKVEIK